MSGRVVARSCACAGADDQSQPRRASDQTSSPTARISASALLRSTTPRASGSRTPSVRPRSDLRSARWPRGAELADELGQREVVRRDQADRAGLDQRAHDRLGADPAIVGVGAVQDLVEQEQHAAGPARELDDARGCAGSRRRTASALPAANPRSAASRRWRERRQASAAAARTGAPASASTALTPTARSSVLLPDMFEPLTMSTRGPIAAEPDVVAHRVRFRRAADAPSRLAWKIGASRRSAPETDPPGARTRRWRARRALRARRPHRATPTARCRWRRAIDRWRTARLAADERAARANRREQRLCVALSRRSDTSCCSLARCADGRPTPSAARTRLQRLQARCGERASARSRQAARLNSSEIVGRGFDAAR